MRILTGCVRALCAAAVAAALWSPLAAADFSDGKVHVGVITDLSGNLSDIAGQGAVIAAEMAVADFQASQGGLEIQISAVDHRNDTETALEAAGRLRQQGLDVMVELGGSNTALPLQRYAAEHDIAALHSGSASSSLTSEACTPVSVHWAYDTYAMGAGVGKSILSNQWHRWFVVRADNEFGHRFEADLSQITGVSGGAVVGNAVHAFGQRNLFGVLTEARDSRGDVIAIASTGDDLLTALRQSYEMGLTRFAGKQVVPLSMTLHDVKQLGLYVSAGLQFATPFYWDRDEETRAWAQRFYDRHGAMPTAVQASVYSSLMHYLRAAAAAETDAAPAVVKQMKAMPVNDFFAPDGELRVDGRMVHAMYLVEVKQPSASDGKWDYFRIRETVPADAAFRPLSYGDCPLVKQG